MLIAFALASCQSSWREQPPPWTADSLANAEYARIQVRDGSVTELRSPSLGSNASGTFVSGDLVSAKQTGEHMVNVPLSQITRLETRGSDSMKVPLLVVALVIVVLGLLSASGVSLTIGI